LVLVLLYFLLASGDLFLRKLIRVVPRFEDKKRVVYIAREIETSISRYLVTQALINAALGTAGGIAFWLLGMPDPALWGVLGAVLNSFHSWARRRRSALSLSSPRPVSRRLSNRFCRHWRTWFSVSWRGA
jgi:hypothetical protein